MLDVADISGIQRVLLGRRFKNKDWLLVGYERIASNAKKYSLDELGKTIGWEATARLSALSQQAPAPLAHPVLNIGERFVFFRCCGRKILLTSGLDFTVNNFDLSTSNLACPVAGCGAPRRQQWVFSSSSWNQMMAEGGTQGSDQGGVSRGKIEEAFKEEIEAIDWYES